MADKFDISKHTVEPSKDDKAEYDRQLKALSVTELEPDAEVAERSPDGSTDGEFTRTFVLDRLDTDINGKTPKGFDHDPNIDGTRAQGVQAGVRFTGPIKLKSDKANPDAPGTRLLTYSGPAVPAHTVDEGEVVNGKRDYYDPEVVNAGEPDEHVESNSAESKDQAE